MSKQSNLSDGKVEDSFSRPVETIMKCEDFKSNFARKLSNRYTSSPILSPKQDVTLKLPPKEQFHDVSKRMATNQLTKITAEQNGEVVKPPDKQTKSHDMRSTKVNALNMEIETLRWQLTQTEANRQMHIALLKQIVSFLNRIKEHIECQKPEGSPESTSAQSSFNLAHLPRSRSALYVNKNLEYSPTKKIYTSKISKSINNMTGLADCSVGNQSKSLLISKIEAEEKLTEEMSRLITLASTVLNTQIPDLACTFNDIELNTTKVINSIDNSITNINRLNIPDKEFNNASKNTCNDIDCVQEFYTVMKGYLEKKCETISESINLPLPLTCGLEEQFQEVKSVEIKDNQLENDSPIITVEKSNGKKIEYNHKTNFIEDESGFSSMSSFQEIGIPIINIIPPTPCKEIKFLDEIPSIFDESAKWKNDTREIDEQALTVFWV